ncbi:electron transfer flavoprotein subunit beta, partial [Streptomyces sp. SP18CM02]|nr:electron transfer flavoprotein subunit beta [Streptomyces sp. SP18CM02]
KGVELSAYDLVVCGMGSSAGVWGVLAGLLAVGGGVPLGSLLSVVSVVGGVVSGRRDGATSSERLEASFPAVVSVTDLSGEARYPSFKGIMAAKKKPVESLDLVDLGLEAEEVGLAGAWT